MRKIELYIISLWLLFFLIAIKEIKILPGSFCFTSGCLQHFIGSNVTAITATLFLILGLFLYYRFTYLLKGSTQLPKEILKIDDQNYEHLTFLTTYIIPFLRVNLQGRDLIVTISLLIIIGAIFVRTNLFYKNPTLALLGYKLYKVDTALDSNLIFISKQYLKRGDKVHHIHLSDNVYFVKT